MREASFALEDAYRSYLRQAQRAHTADHLIRSFRPYFNRHAYESLVQRRWRALFKMREAADQAWPGLEVFARRQLATRAVKEVADALEHLRLTLRATPPPLSSTGRSDIAGLYAFIRRTLRGYEATCDEKSPC